MASWLGRLVCLNMGSVVAGSNPTLTNFPLLLQRIRQWGISYVSADSATLVLLPTENFD